MAWLRKNWNVSYQFGRFQTCATDQGWRICEFGVDTEPLVVHNIGGHQGWQHSLEAILFIGWRGSQAEWAVASIAYERRTATVNLRHRRTGENVTRRFARIEEGTWLEITGDPA